MNNIDDLSSHLANLIQSLYQISSKNDADDAIYQSCFPSNTIDPKKLNNQNQINAQFQPDSIPSADQIQWNVSNVSLSQKFLEVFQKVYQNYEIENNYISEEETQKVAEQIDEIIDQIEFMNYNAEQYHNNLSPFQDPNIMQKIQKQKQKIDQENKKMIEIIQKNIPAVLKMQQKKIKNQISKFGCLPVNLQPSNIIEMLTDNQNHQVQIGFQPFSYNSLNIQGQIKHIKDSFIQKLSEKLQGFGIGQKQSQDKLTLSIKDAFESIQIDLEWKRVDFKRDWLNINLLKILLGELELDGKSFQDGMNKQDQISQIIPYVQIAAIVIKNIKIKGFKGDRLVRRNLMKIQTEPDSNFTFQFQVSPDIQFDDNEMIIQMRTPRILGYIIKPIIPIQKEEHEIEYSMTDNTIIIQKLQRKDFQLRDIMWPKKQKIKVRFIGQDTSQQYFINLINLYRECIQQWLQDKIPLSIDVDENNNYDIFKEYKEGYQLVHVKIDNNGQVFTLGIGNTLQKLMHKSDYNQLFGLKEFNQLIKQQKPNAQIENKCRRVILHELGHVIGFIQEINNNDDQIDQSKVYKSFKKNLQKLQNDSVLRDKYENLEEEINYRVKMNIMNKRVQTNFEKFDERSIMYQPFPKQWLKNQKQIQPNNYPSMQDFSVLDEHYGIFQTYNPHMFQMNMPQNFPTMSLQINQINIDRNFIQQLQDDCGKNDNQNSQENQKNVQPQFQKRQRLAKLELQEQKSEMINQNQIQKQNSAPNNNHQEQIQNIQRYQNLNQNQNDNKKKQQIADNQNQFMKFIDMQQINDRNINYKNNQNKFEEKKEELKVNISQLSNEHQQNFMASVRIDFDQRSFQSTTKNPQSEFESIKNEDSPSYQSQVSDINNEDALIPYHPKIELQRDDIKIMLDEGYNQDIIIENIQENVNMIKGWKNQLIQLIEEVQYKNLHPEENVIDNNQQFLGLKIPQLEEQDKRLLVKILINRQFNQSNTDFVQLKNKINMQTLQTLKNYYDKYGAISNQLNDLSNQEISQCIKYMKKENFQYAQLKKRTLIHESVLKQIYDIELDKLKAHKDLIEPFLQIKDIKLDQDIIAQMIFQENSLLKKYLVNIFKNSYYVYDSFKKYCIKNNIALFILDNEIEEFILQIQNEKNFQSYQKQIQLLKNTMRLDQVYCLQLLYYLNKEQIQNDGQQQKKKVEEVDPKSTWAIKNKNYYVLSVNQNKNIARVINKAFLIHISDDIDSSYNFQAKYEKKKIFENEDQKKVAQFLEEFKKYSSSNLPFNEKQDQFEKHLMQSKINLQKDDYNFVKRYLEEEEGYEQLMRHLGKRISEEKQNDDIEYEDLEQISNNLKVAIVLHQEDDFKNFKAFGSNFNQIQPINIIDHSKSSTYSILKLINLQIKLDTLNVDDFKTKNKAIYEILPLWMKFFFGYKSLMNFIQNQDNKIEYLQELIQIYQRYEKESSEDLQRMLQKQCLIILNADKFIFEEWYKDIQLTKQGQKFASYFDFFMARTNPEYLLKIQIETRKIFEDPLELLTLKDFNRLCARIDKNDLHKLFQESFHDKKVFSQNVINQLFGFLNRRESLQSFVSDLKNTVLSVSLSSRFLMNFLLQNCDLNLRSRILYYQSEYFSVPLLMNCLVSYESRKQNLLYIPEIAFNMLEGAGIFNFAAGSRSIYQIGKSQLLNDILIPIIDNYHEAFEQQDKNIFSSGQVDVFFEKSFEQKRNIVIMDGQGNLKDEAINSTLILTDIVMIHFHRQDFDDQKQLQDLKDKIQMVQNAMNKYGKKIHIMLIVRDANECLILKSINKDKISHTYYQVKDLENSIDSCVQLENMSNLQKNHRIEKIYPLLQHFYSLVEKYEKDKSYYSFTRKNYIDNFLAQNPQNEQIIEIVKEIIQKSQEFMDEVNQIKDNIFQESALPVLDFKNQIRKKIIEIRNTVYNKETDLRIEEEERQIQELKQISDNLKTAKPSKILIKFNEIITNKHSLIILQEIAQQLRIVTQEGIKDAKLRRSSLLSLNVKKSSSHIVSYNESYIKTQNLSKQLNAIDEEIYQKSISLEYFWRALTFYTEHTNSDYKIFSQQNQKKQIFESIKSQLLNGSCYELIDGENLEFKGKILSEVIGKQYKGDKVIVVCVIGPQSSGKSTLMNFAFGTQFFTSSGRCTKGIYFTLQQIPEEFREQSDVKWLLMLDTEGLQSPERIDAEYDRKIVLFAMLSADILIINNKGEINSTMIETLTMCCLTFDNLRKYSSCPEILYVNCQQNEANKDPFKRQLQDMKQKVKEQSESETIDETADELLSVRDENLLIMGYAYKNEAIEMDQKKGIKQNNWFKVSLTNFGVETSNIFKFIKSYIKRKSTKLSQISFWLENSQYNWNLIDKYSSNLIQFNNMLEMKIDKKVQAQLLKLWNDYLTKNLEQDDLKCNEQKQILVDILKKHGIDEMNQELNKFLYFNDQDKDMDFQRYILDPFDVWKMEQKGITVSSEKQHKSLIRSKMDAIQNEFKVKLRAKIQEEQMKMINKNGHKRILNRANEISKDYNYKDLDKQEKKEYLEQQFQENWEKSLDEIQGIAQIDQMKKSYFNSLLKTFKSFNPFIHMKGEQQYYQLLQKLNSFQLNNDFKQEKNTNQEQLIDLIKQELTKIEEQEKNEDSQKLFSFNNEMLYQIKENPKERIFDQSKQEQYLYLKELINCNYIYTINKDLSEELDKDALSSQMFKELTVQKQIQQFKQSYNYYGHSFKEKVVVWVEDVAQQQSNLKLLFQNLRDAGFMINVKDKYSQRIEQKDLKFLDQQIDQFFEDFEPFGKDKDFKRRENKHVWIKQFIDNIIFNKSIFKRIDPRISSCFKSKEYQVKNRPDPNETLEQHQQSIVQLQNALYVQEPQIKYFPSNKAKNINAIAMKILINPIQSESDVLVKWQKLSQIALQQLDWKKIAQQIIASVYRVLGNNDIESRNSSIDQDEDVSIENIMKLNQISYEQVKTLESEYLSVKLREVINSELHSKMGLYMNDEMNAKISWCALLVTWIELFQKAVYSFNKQYNYLKQQRDTYQSVFYKMINEGKNDELTKQSTKAIIADSYKIFIEKIQNEQKKQILESLDEKRELFDSIVMYENIDTYYENQVQSDIAEYLEYVNDPVAIFEKYAADIKRDEIDSYILERSKDTQEQIEENLIAIYQVIKQLQDATYKSQIHWDKIQLSDYFKIEDGQYELQIQDIYELQDSISPVINLVFRRILLGIFDMSPFQQQIESPQKYKKIYLFTPKYMNENGPLEIFSNYYLKNDIQQILENPQYRILLDTVIEIFQSYQLDVNNKVFQINVMIDEIERKIDDYLNKLKKERDFDENWFDVAGPILNLVNTAVGCKSKCKFCNRKCELGQHTQLEALHSCEKMGHQMRVFAGGNFQNDRGDRFPSLLTCDMISPNTIIVLNEQKYTWKEVVETQMQEWEVKFKQQNMGIAKYANTYRTFWETAGREYSQQNNFKYIDYEDNQNLITKMYEKTLIIIAIDESGSMSGTRWKNSVNGSKELIIFLRQNHSFHSDVNLIIIFFDDNFRIVHNSTLDQPIPEEIWENPNYGGTVWGPVILESFNQMAQHVQNVQSARLYFFTDGFAPYPQNELDQIEVQIGNSENIWRNQSGAIKLQILLMSENRSNATLILIVRKFNEISQRFGGNDICQIQENVDTSQIGSIMIENFRFNN